MTILEVLSNSLPISTHRAFHCSQTHFIQVSVFSFNTHKSNPNSEFHFHSLPLTHYSSTNQDITRSSSTIQFIHLIVVIQSLPIYRMIKYDTFLFWTLNQTRFSQFGSTISHKFLIFVLNIDTTKDWNMLAKPIWVVVKDGIESIDDWILNQWLKNDVKDFKQTMLALNIQWLLNGVCDSMLESLLHELVNTNNENGRHIYEWNRINQTSNTRNWLGSYTMEWPR